MARITSAEKSNSIQIAEGYQQQITVIEPSGGWLDMQYKEIWKFRELFYYLVMRDIKVRFKQTIVGAAWIVLQPVIMMLIFYVIFGVFAGLPTDNVPYPVYIFTGLIPWQLFSYALTMSANSLVGNAGLITKIYFPRLVIPLAAVIGGLVDFVFSLGFFVILMIYYHIPFTLRLLWLPALALLTVFVALSVGLWMSALNVRYRDVRNLLPFLMMIWMYATPIMYPASMIPEKFQFIYSLNPLTIVVDLLRWSLVHADVNFGWNYVISIAVVVVLIITGLLYFKRVEDTFADVI